MKNMTAMNAKRKQAGFTIIELVVVILLLGILTATALPRFMDVTDEAHDAVVDAVFGGFTTGVALFRAQWVAEGQPLATATDTTGFNLFASTTGYPRSQTLANTVVAGQTTSNVCIDVYSRVLQAGGRPVIAAADGLASEAIDVSARETAVETAAVAGTDFVAVLLRDNAATTAATVECLYYYVGQFKSGTLTVPANIPVISYNFSTGEVSKLATDALFNEG
jgi:MSHA pilin protein MshB